MGQFSTPKPLTPAEKANWNRFINFVEQQKMLNNPVLDHRNKQVGMSLLQKFNYANPKFALDTAIVPRVQQEIHTYRDGLVKDWKAGKIEATPDVKTEDDIMANISPVDGWPGRKTLSHRFPVAQVVTTQPTGATTVKDYGTDMAAFEREKGKSTTDK